jgi:hypothetical protein
MRMRHTHVVPSPAGAAPGSPGRVRDVGDHPFLLGFLPPDCPSDGCSAQALTQRARTVISGPLPVDGRREIADFPKGGEQSDVANTCLY